MQLKFLNFLPLIALAMPAQAQSDAAKAFGARPAVSSVSISPDGTSLAMIEPTAGRGSVVSVLRIGSAEERRQVLASDANPDNLTSCGWPTNDRILCNVYRISTVFGQRTGETRMLGVNADGSNIRMVSARQGDTQLGIALGGGRILDWMGEREDGTVLMDRYYVPEQTTGRMTAQRRQGLGVDRVNTRNLSRSMVEVPRGDAFSYIADGHGTVRIMVTRPTTSMGYGGHRYEYFYRKKGSRDWLPLSSQSVSGIEAKGFQAEAVDSDLDVVYGIDDTPNGRAGVYRISLDGSMRKELVYDRADVDVTDLIQIGRQHRVVGVSWATDRRYSTFFDPELKKLAAALGKALPNAPLVSFVDASADEQKLVLYAGSDIDAGRYYLFDKATKQLGEIMAIKPGLDKYKLSPVKPVGFPASDGQMIPGYLTLPPGSNGKGLPAIVMPHGGPWWRDEWGFDWLAQFFAHQGYAVFQPNFRGSTGFGTDWLGGSGFKSWQKSIGDINDAGRWLVSQGIADRSKLAILGWSYGGYAALQSAVVDPQLYKAIVAIAPVTDIGDLQQEWKSDLSPASLAAMFGDSAIAQSGSPARHADAFVAPVLLFHGDIDRNVSIAESRSMASRLKGKGKSVELVEYRNLDHQLNDSDARAQMLDRADHFLRSALKLPPTQ
ncbi:S9 family peptidase [Sphingobium sp.]|uniref:S9 family peptidase n=1 Tax=Sphingobium sp. TaxID=1912891 RepID=UPI0028BE4F0E|nr:S9 family peptidase [Sphingobium sp.]